MWKEKEGKWRRGRNENKEIRDDVDSETMKEM